MAQHLDALDRANEVRLAGAAVKREIRAGSLTVAEAVIDRRARSLTIGSVLCAQRRWGIVRAQEALSELAARTIGPEVVVLGTHQRLSALTLRQRDILSVFLSDFCGEPPYEPPKLRERPLVDTAPLADWLRIEFPGWTNAQLAYRCGVDEATIRKVLHGDMAQISMYFADRMVVGLGCPHVLSRLYPEVTL